MYTNSSNLAMSLVQKKILQRDLINRASIKSIIKLKIEKCSVSNEKGGSPKSYQVSSVKGLEVLNKLELPVIVRPSFTLGGTGGAVYNMKEFEQILSSGIEAS